MLTLSSFPPPPFLGGGGGGGGKGEGVSVPPPCYRSSTQNIRVILPKAQVTVTPKRHRHSTYVALREVTRMQTGA